MVFYTFSFSLGPGPEHTGGRRVGDGLGKRLRWQYAIEQRECRLLKRLERGSERGARCLMGGGSARAGVRASRDGCGAVAGDLLRGGACAVSRRAAIGATSAVSRSQALRMGGSSDSCRAAVVKPATRSQVGV